MNAPIAPPAPPPLLQLLDTADAHGGLQTDDVLNLVLPLLREVAALHEQGKVAAIGSAMAYRVDDAPALALARPEGTAPRHAREAIAALEQPAASVLRVVGEHRVTVDAGEGLSVDNLALMTDAASDVLPSRPVYLPGYTAWELRFGHHDALSDILCLGQVLASLACGVDFTLADELGRFVEHRGNLFALNKRLHPVVAAVITEMTALDRHARARDLPSVIRRLETYRDQPLDLGLDRIAPVTDTAVQRRQAIRLHLRDRLFDLSRRNRLLHFKPSQAHVNLTLASVPLVVDVQNIRVDQLCVWDGRFATDVASCDPVPLARWLRFEDQPYLPAALDRILQEARRDRAEYGLSQLSLVVAFLHWHNLKEDAAERIASPLLMLPVELARKKGVKDQYLLEAASSEAQVNPTLRHHLRQLYGIVLPDAVDLRETSIAQFHATLAAQIAASEPAVQLRLLRQPEIDLLHQRARQRLEQFKRRTRVRSGAGAQPAAAQDFSYARDDFRPLGLQRFHAAVRRVPLPIGEALGARPMPRAPQMAPTPAEAEHATFSVRGNTGNPYQWDVDLTAVTLGNFNHRKMSLVRDYAALAETELASDAFDRVFSLQPRQVESAPPAPLLPLAEQWPVVQADATQTAAVALARTGTSYIIQGPPGTGKSQTITNLIADYVGRGRRVLFVCEKRAAIDVVFHRLRQQGLDALCCMIHDSQADKKAFVQNLRQTYEHWLAAPEELEAETRERSQLIDAMGADLQALQRFDAAMRDVPAHLALAVRTLIARLTVLKPHDPALTPLQAEALPAFAAWQSHAGLIARLHLAVTESLGVDCLARHSFAQLAPGLLRHERPLARLAELCERAADPTGAHRDALAAAWPPLGDAGASWRDVLDVVADARRVAALAARGQLALLDAARPESLALAEAMALRSTLQQALDDALQRTGHWRDKLSSADTEAGLAQARAQQGSMWRWLQPSWWRLSGELKKRYDFAAHAVRPQPSLLLEQLQAEHAARAAVAKQAAHIESTYGCTDADAFVQQLDGLRQAGAADPGLRAEFRAFLRGDPAARGTVEQLAALGERTDALDILWRELLDAPIAQPLAALEALARTLRDQADALPGVLAPLQELADADPAVARALRTLRLPPQAIEYAVAHEGLERVYRTERWLPRFDGSVLARHAQRLAEGERQWLDSNARTLAAAVRQRFREHVKQSALPASQLDAEGKQFKKRYSAGRRELEHEFGKTMRYKAIRELASGDTGQVVRDMKPIWLMSPLSVSDTLPLAADLFDVVIFDEASQIPVEEAVPALYRAPQIIVVGDEMQLPPTSFFSSGRDAEDETVSVADEDEAEGGRIAVVLDADSLLNQGARNLPATLLAWHYRSRYESLIGFSNAAFYAGKLYTVPDRSLPPADQAEIVVQSQAPSDAAVSAQADALLSRAISFHRVADAVYAQRRNNGEARHIAQLVRELLRRETGRSLGIVAFSEAQQGEIEAELDALGAADTEFAARLEAEYVREEDDQFCGLFIKNLENVQGDERDIIILSICYGPNAEGRMLMNFGPINQRGGEKRLNVIFSRARHHMAVVSSIRHDAITNDHNEGAAALKQFLRYAECLSRGDAATARRVLEAMNPLARAGGAPHARADEIALQLAAALRARGHTVDEQVGQSRFRCDLALRAPGASHYALGILVDSAAHDENRDVLERYVARPRVLGAFGWQVVQVLAKDWLHTPGTVIEQVELALRRSGNIGAAAPAPMLSAPRSGA